MIVSTRVKIFLSLLFIAITNSLFSREIAIHIVDKNGSSPIYGAYFSYSTDELPSKESNTNKVKTEMTDSHGNANINVDGTIFYEVSFVGYRTKSGSIPASQSKITIVLEEDETMLEDVYVEGKIDERPIKLSAVTTQVMSAERLVETGHGSLQQALQHETPGLNIQKVGFGNEMSMQGLDARHVLFLMDGERMTGDMAGNLDYERFNLHAIERVEIVKGASSTLYGSRAAGAVINLITKKTTKPFEISAGARYGMMNERNYDNPSTKDYMYMYEKNVDKPNLQGWLSAGFHRKKFTGQTDLWYGSTDAFNLYQDSNDEKLYTQEANEGILTKDTMVVAQNMRPPLGIEGNQHVSASQKLYFDFTKNVEIQLYGTYFHMNTYDMLKDLVYTFSNDMMCGAKAKVNIKDLFTIEAKIHNDFYNRSKRHERRDEVNKVYESRIFQPKFILSSKHFKRHNLIAGWEYISDDLTSDRFIYNTMATRSLRETEIYAQDEWQANDKWMLSLGMRGNHSKAIMRHRRFQTMPKFAVKHNFTEEFCMRANYSINYRNPSIKELFFNWDNLGMFQIKGNEDLVPEKSQYISLGGEFTNDKLFLSATAYTNIFRDKIEGIWRVYDMQYNFEYKNLNKQVLTGIDILSKWNISDHFTLNASYSFVNISKTDGLQLSATSPSAATGSLEYKLKKDKYALTAVLSATASGKKRFDVQDRLYMADEGTSYDAYYRVTLPAYGMANIATTHSFNNRYRLTVGCDNILNYKPKTLGSGITVFNIPATPGARGYVQLEVTLDKKEKK
ncbi:MAG: TonB-dependent receptor [Bacteroidales bacterium]|nr:TonB-dependent receptor [Candidatus Scybalocola fimicaballi]